MKRNVAVLLAVLAGTFSTAAPAAAADELGISSDGVSFAPTFHGPLFDSAVRWVPGDSRTATFYVRNQSSDAASLTITLLGNHIGDLLESGDVTVTATAAGGESSPVSDADERLLLIASGVNGGEVVPVDVRIDFAASSPNPTQVRSTDLHFRITLTQSTSTPADGDGNDGGNGNGWLPDTGGSALWAVLVGPAILAAGIALTSRRRAQADIDV